MRLETKQKPVLIYHSENLGPLRIMINLRCVLYKWNYKAWMLAHLFTTWFDEYFKPTIATHCSEKDSFQNITVHWQCIRTQEFWWRCTVRLMLFSCLLTQHLTFPGSSVVSKESTCQYRRHRRCRFSPWIGKISWRRKWQPIPVFLPGKSHGQRNLASYSPWGP